jgi:hypothetical protein
MKIELGVRTYQYKHTKNQFFYLTLNGSQIGGVMFSLREAQDKIESIKRGEPLYDSDRKKAEVVPTGT